MKTHDRLSLLPAVLFFVVGSIQAQEAATGTVAAEPAGVAVTTSQATVQVSGSAPALRTGLAEGVAFSGSVVVHATVVTDPALPTGVTLYVDCKGIRGTGNDSRTVYVNSCEANVTRLFRPKDQITLTFAFFEDKPGAFLKAKTGVVTINLTYDEATKKLTGATGAVGTFDAAATGSL